MNNLVPFPKQNVAIHRVMPSALHKLYRMCEPLDPVTEGGGLSKVLQVSREKIFQVCNIGESDLENDTLREKFEALLGTIIKEARLDDFQQALFEKEQIAKVPKDRMMVFGKHGNIVKSLPQKVLEEDGPEAARLMAIFGNFDGVEMGKAPGSAIDVLRLVENLGNDDLGLHHLLSKEFVKIGQQELSLMDFWQNDPWLAVMIANMHKKYGIALEIFANDRINNDYELMMFNREFRCNPLNESMLSSLEKYFRSKKQWGVRTSVRKLGYEIKRLFAKNLRALPRRSGHPKCGFDEGKRIIEEAFKEFGETDFTLRESNLYAASHEAGEYEGFLEEFDQEKALERKFEDILEGNERTLELLVERFFTKATEMHYGSFFSGLFSSEDVKNMFEEILEKYHRIPEIERADSAKMFSFAGLKLFFEIFRHVIGLRMHMPYHMAKNENYQDVVKKYAGKCSEDVLMAVVGRVMSDYREGEGLQEGDFHYEYEPIPKVNYTFQEKFGVVREGETVIANLGIDDLRQEQNWHFLAEFPDLAKKLLVFGVLGYRLYNETGFLLDLRPEKNVLMNLLLNGEYAFSTGNVRILLKINSDGKKESEVKILDNKDHFQAPQKGAKYPGLAKTGFGMAGWIGKPAWERFIGKCVDSIWKNELMEKEFGKKFADCERVWGELLGQWMEVFFDYKSAEIYKKVVKKGGELVAEAGSFARSDEVFSLLADLCKKKIGGQFPVLCSDLIAEIGRAAMLKSRKILLDGPSW